MTVTGFSAPAPDAALDALFLPFATGELDLPADGRVLFLHARDGFRLRETAQPGWLCEQSFKPFADALRRSGHAVGEPSEGDTFARVLMLPPRSRDASRALLARALTYLAPSGVVLASVPNAEGARSSEADLARLAGPLRSLSKHKCRVFWTRPGPQVDKELLADWLALDGMQTIAPGLVSRPGLFAWDRIDTASALLAAQLPADLQGRVADLGAGYGFLSTRLLAQCPGIDAVDLYEAEARALEPSRANLEYAVRQSGRTVSVTFHWHDVTQGLPHRYDAIVSNPPFHQGRADLPELGRAFIAAAADALLPHGRFWLVANRHLPYESVLARRFNTVRTMVVKDGFKVIEASGAHA
ncbi:class I SAM-dependent methyltransferase [Dyella sp. A6]|uniref:class I SAM-dependent methyltransferase n=1 Tax=Dyella aluminiiresistens TaxID=3069105 RepID=UPI002E76CB86|nr:methyltransferase [Dyella sp. A6]